MANFSLNLSQLGGRFAKDLLTLSLEASSVRLMVSSGRNISGGLNMPVNPRLVTDGRVEDPAGLSQIIKNGVSRLGFKGGAVVAAFPSLRVNARILNLPSVRGIKPEMAIPREARRIIGSALDFQELFWAPINVVGGGQSYYLVAAPKTELGVKWHPCQDGGHQGVAAPKTELIAFHQTLGMR